MQKELLSIRVCNFITKYCIYALIFLIPVFFLPWTADFLDFNKQSLLLLLVFVSLFAFMVKTLILGKFEINKGPMNAIAGVLFFVYLLATIFSINRYGSFWGQAQQVSEGLVTIICILVFYFLVSNIFSKKEVITSVVVFSFSALIAEVVGVFQLLGVFFLPFEFAKSVSFNTIGSVGSLGLFAAIFLPVAMVMMIIMKKWWKLLFALEIVASTLVLVLVNYSMIWWIVIAGSALLLIVEMVRGDIFDGRWMVLPMFFLVVSLFFVLLNPQINWISQKPNEVFLSQEAGLDIALPAIKENPILGSGPGTFAYDFLKFKNPDFSKGSLWNITFNKSSSKILNSVATTGVFGLLAMILFMIYPIVSGIKSFFSKNNNILLIGLLVVLIEQGIAYFVYNSNIVLDFVFFFTVAVVTAIISKGKKEYVLKPSSTPTLVTTLVFTLVFIFGVGLIIIGGQRYTAEVNYYKGIISYQAGQKEVGLKSFEKAANLNSQSDIYFKQLSQAYLLSLQDKIQNISASATDQEKTEIQTLMANSINAGKVATDINPQDASNWAFRGYIYQNLIGVYDNASIWAMTSYDSALKLDPNNPYLFMQEGNVYLTDALKITDSSDQKNQLLGKAQEKLEKAVELNNEYSNAIYSLGIVYNSLGQKAKAIDVFTKLQQLNPTNTEVQAILNSLKEVSTKK